MSLQGLFGILLKNRASLESIARPQLAQLLSPYQELLQNVDLKELCPTPTQLQALISAKDSIETSIIALQRRTVPLQSILEKVQVILSTIPIIITLIKALPIPNQVTTVGFVTTLSDRLETVKELLQKYRGEVVAGQYVIAAVNGTFTQLLQQLDALDQIIALCAPEQLQTNEELQRLSESFNTPITQFNNSYRGYTIEIRIVREQSIAPQRYAVAIDSSGVAVLEGRPSYSSSTQVLVDEIKFRIDQLSA
jgi:hypothetical protein